MFHRRACHRQEEPSRLTSDSLVKKSLSESNRTNPTVLDDLDDDGSVTSTSSEESVVGKSVHFAKTMKVYEPTISKQEAKCQWYTVNEIKRFKAKTINTIQSTKRLSERERATKAWQSVMLDVYEMCLEATDDGLSLNKKQRRCLERCMEESIQTHGLSALAIKEIHLDRSMRRSEIVFLVLELQKALREEKLGYDEAAEVLRKNAESVTRTSKLFARLTAQASADSLHNEWMELASNTF